MSAQTGELATTPHPLGKPGGPGLFHDRSLNLPPYIQNIAHSLMEKRGMDKSKAIQMAIGVVQNWASGRGDVRPEVRAAATAAVAQWEAAKAKAKATPNKGDVKLSWTAEHGPELQLSRPMTVIRSVLDPEEPDDTGWGRVAELSQPMTVIRLALDGPDTGSDHDANQVDLAHDKGEHSRGHLATAGTGRDLLALVRTDDADRIWRDQVVRAVAESASARLGVVGRAGAGRVGTGSPVPGTQLRESGLPGVGDAGGESAAHTARQGAAQRERTQDALRSETRVHAEEHRLGSQGTSSVSHLQAGQHGTGKGRDVSGGVGRAASPETGVVSRGEASEVRLAHEPVDAPARKASDKKASDKKTKKQDNQHKKGRHQLPPGATHWKHNWQPVDDQGRPVGPPQKDKSAAEIKDMVGHEDATKAAIAQAYQNKSKADTKKAATKAKSAAHKAKTAANQAARKEAAAKRRAAAEAKRRVAAKLRAKKQAAAAAKREAAAKAKEKAAKVKARQKLVAQATKQALADKKAGRILTPSQQKLIAAYEKQQADTLDTLRNGVNLSQPMSLLRSVLDGSPVDLAAPAAQETVPTVSSQDGPRATVNMLKANAPARLAKAVKKAQKKRPGRRKGVK